MSTRQKILYMAIGLVVGAAGAGFFGYSLGARHATIQSISSFDECVAAGYPVRDIYPEQCGTPDGRVFTNTPGSAEQPVIFEGKVVCLPHVNSNGPQTLECATGLQTDDGSYYILKTDDSGSELAGAAGSDRQVRISGTLAPTQDSIYKNKGTLEVAEFTFL